MRPKDTFIKFERIAVLPALRGQGLGCVITNHMAQYSIQRYPRHLPAMHAQTQALGFYERLGWIAVGDLFFEAGIEHRLLIYPPKTLESFQNLLIWKDPGVREDIKLAVGAFAIALEK